jgi:hypothetical protein
MLPPIPAAPRPAAPPHALRQLSLYLCMGWALAACVTPPASTPPARTPVPAGAAAPAPSAAPSAAPVPAPPGSAIGGASPGAAALRDGVSAFELGEYRRAETRLAESQKLGLSSVEEQTRAHKTLAFLYCITRRTAQCEKAFEAAFGVDKKFDLSRAERGHPIWGPVFQKVLDRQPR